MRKLIFAVALAVVTAVAAFGAAKSQTVTVSAKPGDDLNAKLEELRGKAGAGGGELVLEDGVYVMKSTVAFKASDSNLTVRAKNLGKATLAGGWVFKGADFKKVTDGRLLSRLPKAVREKCVEVAIPAEVYDARVKGFASKPRMPEAMPIFTVDATYQGVSHWPNGRERYYLENTNFVGLAGHEVRDRNGKTSVVSNSVLRLEGLGSRAVRGIRIRLPDGLGLRGGGDAHHGGAGLRRLRRLRQEAVVQLLDARRVLQSPRGDRRARRVGD